MTSAVGDGGYLKSDQRKGGCVIIQDSTLRANCTFIQDVHKINLALSKPSVIFYRRPGCILGTESAIEPHAKICGLLSHLHLGDSLTQLQ